MKVEMDKAIKWIIIGGSLLFSIIFAGFLLIEIIPNNETVVWNVTETSTSTSGSFGVSTSEATGTIETPSYVLLFIPAFLACGTMIFVFQALKDSPVVKLWRSLFWGLSFTVLAIPVLFYFKPGFPFNLIGWIFGILGVVIIVATVAEWVKGTISE